MKKVLFIIGLLLIATRANAQVHPCDVPQVTTFTIQGPVNSVDVQTCMFVTDNPTGIVATVDNVDKTGGSFTQLTPIANSQGLAQYSITIAAPTVGSHTISVWSVSAGGRSASSAGPFTLIIAGPSPVAPRPPSHVNIKAS